MHTSRSCFCDSCFVCKYAGSTSAEPNKVQIPCLTTTVAHRSRPGVYRTFIPSTPTPLCQYLQTPRVGSCFLKHCAHLVHLVRPVHHWYCVNVSSLRQISKADPSQSQPGSFSGCQQPQAQLMTAGNTWCASLPISLPKLYLSFSPRHFGPSCELEDAICP